MSNITLYTTRFCPFCIRAKQLLAKKQQTYADILIDEIPVDTDYAKRLEMQQKSGRNTVPQIWIDQRHIGGCDELYALERTGELDRLLEARSGSGE